MDTHWLNLTLGITVIQKKSKYDLFDWGKSEMTSYFRKSVKTTDLPGYILESQIMLKQEKEHNGHQFQIWTDLTY